MQQCRRQTSNLTATIISSQATKLQRSKPLRISRAVHSRSALLKMQPSRRSLARRCVPKALIRRRTARIGTSVSAFAPSSNAPKVASLAPSPLFHSNVVIARMPTCAIFALSDEQYAHLSFMQQKTCIVIIRRRNFFILIRILVCAAALYCASAAKTRRPSSAPIRRSGTWISVLRFPLPASRI